jgi:hypothetical protein
MVHSAFTPEPTSTGIRFGNRVIGYSVAVRQLDNGNYDKRIPDGLDLLACIMEAIESGWFTRHRERNHHLALDACCRSSLPRSRQRTAQLRLPTILEGLTPQLSTPDSTVQSVFILRQSGSHSQAMWKD